MTLTAQEQREMYADIKVIKNNCVRCFKCQEDHEERLQIIEKFVQEVRDDKKYISWISGGIGGLIVWLLTFIKDVFIR